MAGFEVVVRPMILPNIRPAPPRVLAPEDDPTQGFYTIGGSGGGSLIDLPRSWNVSVSRQQPQQESKRQYDTERVYQTDDQGNINRSNYIDVERLKKVRLETEKGPVRQIFADPPPADNVQILETDLTR